MSENKPNIIYRLDNAKNFRVAVVRSLFNEAITEKLEQGAIDGLVAGGFNKSDIIVFTVPGAMEIPLSAQMLFEAGFEAVVAVGCVIRGETTHYTTVCEACERGCMEVQLKFSCPVGFGVIMTENWQQAEARSGGHHGNKGFEAAQAVIRMLQLKIKLKETQSIENKAGKSFPKNHFL